MTKQVTPSRKSLFSSKSSKLEQKLFDAKKRLQLAEQNSSYEIEQLRAEFEKKKQAAMGNVQTLEKDIATKAVDNSAGVRKEAAKALVDAVKSLAQKKTEAPIPKSEPAEPEVNAQS